MHPSDYIPYAERPVETDEHDIWREETRTDDHDNAIKGMIAGACLSAPVWLLIAWAVGVI